MFYKDSFGNDGAGVETSLPFAPIHVGDLIDPSAFLAVEKGWYRVTAVRHSFQMLDCAYQYTDYCIEDAW
jgi:hypothetical protein